MRISYFRSRCQQILRLTRLGFESLETRRLLAVLDPVNDTSSFPASATVQIRSVWDSNGNNKLDDSDEKYFCSGAMISRFQVLSAGHCVFLSEEGGFADWIFAHPGRQDRYDRPFGEVEATEWYVPSAYSNRESNNFDVSIIVLDRNIGDFTGWFGYTAINEPIDPGPRFSIRPQPQSYHLNVSQYPADHGYSGYKPYKSDTNYVVFPQTWITPTGPRPFFNVSMTKMWTAQGSSGSPLYLDNGQIVGVLSNGDDIPLGQSGIDNYVKLNNSLTFPISWITSTLAENTSPADRPVIVNRDQWFNKSPSNLISSSSPHTGDSIQLKAPLFNAGTAQADNVKVRFRLSTDEFYDNTDQLLGDSVVTSIGALKEATATLTAKLPSVSARDYHVVWRIDPDNTISEFDVRLHDLAFSETGHHTGNSGLITVDDDAYESNDSRGAAFSLAAASWLSSIGDRGVQYDDDFFRITVPSGQLNVQATLRFEHKLGDIDLQLLDSTGSVIASSRGIQDNETISALVPTGGTYFLRVFYANSGNTYDLRWESLRAPDLIAKDIQFSTLTLEAGDTSNLRFAIENTGGSAGEFRVRAFLSRDASIDPSGDLSMGSVTIASLGAGQSTATQTLQVRLPAAGTSFWNGDGEYFIGLVVDESNTVIEGDETNNYSRGLGIDVASFQAVVHPYGTFTVTTSQSNRIVLPRFDQTRGTLTSVEVSVLVTGVTDVDVFPALAPNLLLVDSHSFSFSVGAFAFAGNTIPMPRFSREAHIEQLTPTTVLKTYSGSQLSTFLSGTQQWTMPTGLKTGPGFSGNTHNISQLTFTVTTKFLFNPPPADLRATSLVVTNGPAFNGKDARTVNIDFALENLGPGPAPQFKTSFYISQDATITTDDVLLRTYEFSHGMSALNNDQQSITLTLPHATTNFWLGDKQYYVGMIIDTAGLVPESNRSNNSNLGMAIDKAAIDVVVKPVGTDVTLLIETNKITLQNFDSSRGVLRRVEGMSYLVQGNTNALFQPIPHAHVFNFPLGPFEYFAVAIPIPSAAIHPVVTGNVSRVTLTGDELTPFLAGTRTLNLDPKPTSTQDFGHVHTLENAVFNTELWYTFDVLPNLRSTSISVAGNLLPSGKGTVNFNVSNDSAGDAEQVKTELRLIGPAGLAGPTRILGQSVISSLRARTSTPQSIAYSLPEVDDEFWSTAGQYRLALVIDPDGEVTETNELDNSLAALNTDFVNFQVPLRQNLTSIDLGRIDYHQQVLNLSSSDQWYRVEASRTGQFTFLVTSNDTQPLRQTLFKVPAELQNQINLITEQAIRPYALNQAPVRDGLSRIDVDAQAGDVFLLRVAGSTTTANLTLANVLQRSGNRVTLNGSAVDDLMAVTGGEIPTVSIGPIVYGLDRSIVTEVNLIGAGGHDEFFIQALPTIAVTVSDALETEKIVVDSQALLPTIAGNTVLIDQRQPIQHPTLANLRLINVPHWHNLIRENDVNNDGLITPIDALLVINQLNVGGPSALPSLSESGSTTDTYLDVSGDEFLSAIDALLIINQLNQRG